MAQRKSREDWVDAAALALTERGVAGVKVERLARDLGVTKGSFYWHFGTRRELLDALLQTWASRGTAAIIEQVEVAGGDAESRLRRLWEVTAAGGEEALELALRDWARRDPGAAAAVAEVDERRMHYLRTLLREAGAPAATVEARCLLMYSLLIGDWFLDVGHGRKSRGRVLREALDLLLAH